MTATITFDDRPTMIVKISEDIPVSSVTGLAATLAAMQAQIDALAPTGEGDTAPL